MVEVTFIIDIVADLVFLSNSVNSLSVSAIHMVLCLGCKIVDLDKDNSVV